jgi:tetratricopeptide (TPR) repeat protein
LLEWSERRIERELVRQRGLHAAPDLWGELSDTRAARGLWDASLDALRAALSDTASRQIAPWIVLGLARRSLEAGRPDSALVYTSWGESGFEGTVRPGAILLSARVWEARGTTDSALVAYQRFLDSYSQAPHASAEAMFRRGVLFENSGRWEQARTEFRALAAGQPTDSLGLEALTRIVRHHAESGEHDLAKSEGLKSLEVLAQLMATQRDETVQFNVRRTRADVLFAMGDMAGACDALEDLWRRYPGTATGVGSALRGADVAENQLKDRNRAIVLYRGVAERARDAEARRRARAALIRLGAERV